MPERIDQQVAGLVGRADPAPELSSGWEARALARMQAVRSVPGRPWLRRAAVVAAAAAIVAVCLLATTSSSRRGRQAWGRAFAGIQAAKSLHVVGEAVVDGTRYDFEEWRDKDGFYRCEFRQGGALKQLWVTNGLAGEIHPRLPGTRSPFWGQNPHRLYLPRLLSTQLFSSGERPAVTTGARRDVPPATEMEELLERWQHDYDGLNRMDLTDYTQRTPEGRTQHVLELSGASPTYIIRREGEAVSGLGVDTYRLRAVTDPGTDRVVALSEDWLEEGQWVNWFQTSLLEMDTEIPPYLRVMDDVPPGHVIVRQQWWSRLQLTLAAGMSQDWEATLHAVDVNRGGDLFVTFSRRPRPGSSLPTGKAPLLLSVTATDDAGARYRLCQPQGDPSSLQIVEQVSSEPAVWALPDDHLRVRLSRAGEGAAVPPPPTVTITLTMVSPPRQGARQSITWTNVTLPPRQSDENLWQEQIETEAH